MYQSFRAKNQNRFTLFPHPTFITKSPKTLTVFAVFHTKFSAKLSSGSPAVGLFSCGQTWLLWARKWYFIAQKKGQKKHTSYQSFIGVYPWFFPHLLQSILSFSTKVTFHLMINSWNSNIRITLLFKMRVQGWNLMDSDFDDSSKNEFLGKGNYWWCCIIVFLEGSFLVLVWVPFLRYLI